LFLRDAGAVIKTVAHGRLSYDRAGGLEKSVRAMTIFAVEAGGYRRRWVISAVLVVVVHVGIAAALTTWRVLIKQPEPFGPVVIELAPGPAAPTSQHAALPPTLEQVVPNPLPDKPIERFEETTKEKPAEKGEEKGEPKQIEEPPRVAAPSASTPSAGIKGSSGIEVNPIDTRIAEPDRHPKKAVKTNNQRKAVISRQANSGERQPVRNPGAALDIERNAIGIHPNAIGVTPKAAIGGAATSAVGSPVPNAAVAGPTKNAIGATAMSRPGVAGASIGHQGTALISAVGTTVPPASINGTRMIRPGSGASAVGGAAKNGGGVINGTGIQSKQP
jgi:hypothetical protein